MCFRDVAQFGRALRSGRRGRRFKSCHLDQYAAVVELADTRDLKSLAGNSVPVQVRLAAPSKECRFYGILFLFSD